MTWCWRCWRWGCDACRAAETKGFPVSGRNFLTPMHDTLLHTDINILHLIYFSVRRGRPEQRWKQTEIIHKNIWTNTGTVFPISGEGNAVWNVHNLTCQGIFEPLRQIWEYLYNFTAMLPQLWEFLLVTWRLSLKSAEYYSSILLYVMSSPLISAVANFVGNSKFLPGNNLYNILFVIGKCIICTISSATEYHLNVTIA